MQHLLSALWVALLITLAPLTSFAKSLSVITYGDSITAGLKRTGSGAKSCPAGIQQRSDGNCYGNGAQGVGGYQPRLKNLLVADNHSVLIYNYGVSGIRTDQMLNNLNVVLNARPSSNYVLLMGGANDAYINFNQNTVATHLLLMVNHIKESGKIPILATVTPNTSSSSLVARIASYNAKIKEIAIDYDIVLADQFTALNVNWHANHSGDALHISNTGDARMADQWYATLKEELKLSNIAITPLFLLLFDDPL